MGQTLFTEAFYKTKASFPGATQPPNHRGMPVLSEQVEAEKAWLSFGSLHQQQLTEVLEDFNSLAVSQGSALANEQPTHFTPAQHVTSIAQLADNIRSFKTRLWEPLNPEKLTAQRLFVGNRIYILCKDLTVLLREGSLSLNKSIDLIQQFSQAITVCPEGFLTHLEDIIRELREPVLNPMEFILSKKEQLIGQIIAEYVGKYIFYGHAGLHHVNALFNALAAEFGLTGRSYESHVKTESLQDHHNPCIGFVHDKMTPRLLISHIVTSCLNEIVPVIMRYKNMTHAIPSDQFEDFSTDFTQKLAPYPCFNFNTFCLDNSAISKPVSIRMNSLNEQFLESTLAFRLMSEGFLQEHKFELLYHTTKISLYTLANHWFFLKKDQDFEPLDLSSLIELDPLKIEQPDTAMKQTLDKWAPLITDLVSRSSPETARECPIRYIYTVEHLMVLSALLRDSAAKDYFLINIKSLQKETNFLFKTQKKSYEFIINFPMTARVLRDHISVENSKIRDNQQHLFKLLYTFILSRKINTECLNLLDDLPLFMAPKDFINIALFGEAAVVKKILPKLVGINETDKDGLTPLMLASRCTLEGYRNSHPSSKIKPLLDREIIRNPEKNLAAVVQTLLGHPGIAIN